MTGRIPDKLRAELVKAALLDSACVLGGGVGYLVTGNWVWLVGGVLLGAGFILPALITIMKSRK